MFSAATSPRQTWAPSRKEFPKKEGDGERKAIERERKREEKRKREREKKNGEESSDKAGPSLCGYGLSSNTVINITHFT